MRMSQDDKDRSHARIIESASRLLRGRGLEGASVNDVMTRAGMTHGGFYKHFSSKEALVSAALDQAFDDIAGWLEPDRAAGKTLSNPAQFQDYYLSDDHVAFPALGCPIAALGGDIARGPAAVKARFAAGVRRVAMLLARGLPGPERTRRDRAIRQIAMMAGAVMIARASDPETAKEVLAACRARPTDASGKLESP